jgi:8-oxo-dGTP diphosphatase/2-hydroxy-dATP diphosphatase
MKIVQTLVFVLQNNKILLGYKKRGFGAGRWNGFGGKLNNGETIESAARREVKEEAGIELNNLEKVGVLDFEFEGTKNVLEVNIFQSISFSGEIVESDEMKPQWFEISNIPFGEMWPDDTYWIPLFLEGKKFTGRFLFGNGEKNPIIIKHEIVEEKI